MSHLTQLKCHFLEEDMTWYLQCVALWRVSMLPCAMTVSLQEAVFA